MRFPNQLKTLLLYVITAYGTWSFGQCSSTCDYTISTSVSTNYTLNTGDTLCFQVTGGDITYSGNVTFNPGGVIDVCTDNSTVTWTQNLTTNNPGRRYFNLHGNVNRTGSWGSLREIDFVIDSGKTLSTTGNIGTQSSGTGVDIVNNGTLDIGGTFTFQSGNLDNNGTVSTGGQLSLNNNASIESCATCQFDIGGHLTWNQGSFTNEGILTVNGNVSLNSTSTMDNSGSMTTTGDVTFNSGSWSNTGILDVGDLLVIQGGVSVDITGGIFMADDLTINSGNFTVGAGGNCSAFLIKNNTILSDNINLFGGTMEITDSTNSDTVNTNNCNGGDEQCGITFSSNNSCYTVLPSHWISHRVHSNQDGIHLSFNVTNESNTSHYIVYGSNDGKDFSSILRLESYNDQIGRYNITLDEHGGYVYYLIEKIDFNGNTVRSPVLCHSKKGNEPWISYDRPTVKIMGISPDRTLKITLYDTMGRILWESNEVLMSEVNLPDSLPVGRYLIEIKTENMTHYLNTLK